VNLRALVPIAAAAAALLSAALTPAVAHAGTYSITVDTGKDTGGWSFTGSSGFSGCALRLHPGPCGDDDVPNPTPLRIFGFGQAPNLGNAWWQWDAPATTTIASGSLSVTYKTAAVGTSAYMKARLRSESFPSSPQVHSATGNASDTWSIPAGNQVIGVFLKTDIARDYTNKWNNNLSVTSLTATLTDDTAPVIAVAGSLADGSWHNEGQALPVTVSATDAGAGVASATLAEAGVTLDSNSVARQTGIHAGLTAYSHDLAATPATLGDGIHTLDVTVADAGGERAVAPVVVRVDAHAPVATAMVPAGPTTDLRAPVSFSVDPGPSGLGQFDASVDGTPMTIAGNDASYLPGADLAYSTHTVTWHATDGAGNVRDGFWTFVVRDAVAPVLSDVRPDDGSSTSDASPVISVAVADAGVGVDPASIVMTLDGNDMSAHGAFSAGRFSSTPGAPLGFGLHTVVVRASDLAGNRSAPLSWSFDERDDTPPVVSGRTPLPGSTVPGASAIGFDVSDAGAGVDPAALHVIVDGSDVTAWGAYASGHFSYAPGALSAGVHTVSVSAADNAGNVAGPVSWQFAVADPAVLRLAVGGPASLVAGGRASIRFVATASGTPLAGVHVVISTRPAGQRGFRIVRTLTTGSAGAVSWSVAPLRTTAYRAALEAAPAVTATRSMAVMQRVALAVDHLRIHPGGTVRLSGFVFPGHPGGRVRVQLLTGSGWRTVARPRLGVRSRFAKTVVAGVSGRYVLRVVAPATPRDAIGRSRSITVRVR
jgi:hypothetical protein